MTPLEKAIEKIEGAKKLTGKHISLKLNSLDLTTEDLNYLIDIIIRELPNVTLIDLNSNRITKIPDRIGTLKKIRILNFSKNNIHEIPDAVVNLDSLIYLIIKDNNIVTVPEVLSSFQSRLFSMLLENNPLSRETMSWIDLTFGNRVCYNMAAHNRRERHAYKTIITDLYGNESGDNLIIEISKLSEEKYSIIRAGNDIEPASGKRIIEAFLNKVSTKPKGTLKDVYDAVLKHYLEEVLSQDAVRKNAVIEELSIALGDCPTPVHNQIIKKALGLYVENPEKFKDIPNFDKVIERAALEDKLRKTFNFSINEGVEKLQGLINSIYLVNAEGREVNQIKISGERERFPSVSAYPVFAFRQVKQEWVAPFVQMCCKTNESNNPKRDTNGCYELDQKKLDDIKKIYLYDVQGDKTVDQFKTKWDELFKSEGLADVMPLLSSENQEAIDMEKDDKLVKLIYGIEDGKDLEKEVTTLFKETIEKVKHPKLHRSSSQLR
jgi:hypothetical protein